MTKVYDTCMSASICMFDEFYGKPIQYIEIDEYSWSWIIDKWIISVMNIHK